jgi:predicted metal-binding membrane protein
VSSVERPPGVALALAVSRRSFSRGVAWPHPEWWCLAVSALAWLALVTASAGAGLSGLPNGSHDHAAPSAGGRVAPWVAGTLHWSVMVVAMMLPAIVDSIRITAARSVWARRHRAIGGFLVGYLLPWTILGLGTSVLVAELRLDTRLPLPAMAAFGFGVAAAWQLTAVKWRAVRSCHRTAPLAPRGWRADLDCVRYGWAIGGRCVTSCWALMLACLLARHGLVAMTCATVIGAAERYSDKPSKPALFGATAALAVIYATAAWEW